MQLINAVFCISMLVLYNSQISQYALYLQNSAWNCYIVQNLEPSYYEYCLAKQEY